MDRIPLLLLLVCLSSIAALGQDLSITQVKQKNQTIIISYELHDTNIDRKYALHLYSSHDNFVQPLQFISGDVGIDISVGGNKQVVWDVYEEFGPDFSGDLAFELKGSIYNPFIKIDAFDDGRSFKRGKDYPITWTGGRGDNIMNFELLKGEEQVYVIPDIPNVGNTVITMPKVKPGKDYRFKITDSRNPDEIIYTDNFEIKRSIPLVAQIGVSAVVAGVVAYLVSSSGEPETPQELPDPVDPQ